MIAFKRGLIVGKFAPLHLGHDFIIQRALKECEELVLLSYTNPEFPNISPRIRRQWLTQFYPKARVIVLDQDSNYTIPLNSASDLEQRNFTLKIYLQQVGQSLDAIYTSESYGDGFAQLMTEGLIGARVQSHPVQHICIDQARTKFPISGTQIRNAPFQFRQYLPPEVASHFVQTVVFLGAESTGKSTLCRRSAERLRTEYVEEYGRTLWEEKNGNLVLEDFPLIAKTQIQNEETKRPRSNAYLFADTSPLTTLFYCEAMCGEVHPELVPLAQRTYDFTFLCIPDFPLVQDGTRSDEDFRSRQHQWYLQQLKHRNIPFTLLAGPLEDRINKVISILSTQKPLEQD